MMVRSLETAFTRDQHRANAERCRREERRLRSATGMLGHAAKDAARHWRENARAYDEMAEFLDTLLATESRTEFAYAAASEAAAFFNALVSPAASADSEASATQEYTK